MTDISLSDSNSYKRSLAPYQWTKDDSGESTNSAKENQASKSFTLDNGLTLKAEIKFVISLFKGLGITKLKETYSSTEISSAKNYELFQKTQAKGFSNSQEAVTNLSAQLSAVSANPSKDSDIDLGDLDFDDFEGDLDFSDALDDWSGILTAMGAMQTTQQWFLNNEFKPDFYLHMMQFLNQILEGMLRFNHLNNEEEILLRKIKWLQKKLLRLWTRMLQDRPRRRKRNFPRKIQVNEEEAPLAELDLVSAGDTSPTT